MVYGFQWSSGEKVMVAFNCMPINTEQWDFQELKALVGSSGQFPAANVLLLNMEPGGGVQGHAI